MEDGGIEESNESVVITVGGGGSSVHVHVRFSQVWFIRACSPLGTMGGLSPHSGLE